MMPKTNPFLSPDITYHIDRNWTIEPNDMSDFNYEIKLYYTDQDLILGDLIEGDITPYKI